MLIIGGVPVRVRVSVLVVVLLLLGLDGLGLRPPSDGGDFCRRGRKRKRMSDVENGGVGGDGGRPHRHDRAWCGAYVDVACFALFSHRRGDGDGGGGGGGADVDFYHETHYYHHPDFHPGGVVDAFLNPVIHVTLMMRVA